MSTVGERISELLLSRPDNEVVLLSGRTSVPPDGLKSPSRLSGLGDQLAVPSTLVAADTNMLSNL